MTHHNHPSQEDLTLYYYGESEGDLAGHLEDCQTCRRRMEALSQMLGSIGAQAPPHRGDDYAMRVWEKLQPQLEPKRRFWFSGWPQWVAPVAGFACLFVAVFLAGRLVGPDMKTETVLVQGGQRVFDQIFKQHLDQLQMFWLDVGSQQPAREQRVAARELVSANRLYRNVAHQQGQDALVSFLDDLEIVMLEIANNPELSAEMDEASVRQLEDRTEILFKINVLRSQIEQVEQPPADQKNI